MISRQKGDTVTSWLMDQEKIEIPEPFYRYRRLRAYSGRQQYGSTGPLPFLWSGGFMDQPYIASLEIEACIAAELEFSDVAVLPE